MRRPPKRAEVRPEIGKIIRSRPNWRRANQVKRLRIMMTVIAVVLMISVTAGLALIWMQMGPVLTAPASSAPFAPSSSLSEEASVQPPEDNRFELLLVNQLNALPDDYRPRLTQFDSVQVDERISESLRQMMDAAQKDGCALEITHGYVSVEEQEKLYQNQVEVLVGKGYSRVKAEDEAQTIVERGGKSEYQTGLAVDFSAQGSGAQENFAASGEYQWLVANSVEYGFVLRFPEKKADLTGKQFQPGHFRYVGAENAGKMRELGMCLEEYAPYVEQQIRK